MRLDPRGNAMCKAPFDEWLEEVLDSQFRECQVIVISNVRRERPCVVPKCRQIGLQVVSATPFELSEHRARPVGSIYLQAVAEYRVNWPRTDRRQFTQRAFADRLQEYAKCLAVEMIEYVAFHANRRPLHLRARRTVDKHRHKPSAFWRLPCTEHRQLTAGDNFRVDNVWHA